MQMSLQHVKYITASYTFYTSETSRQQSVWHRPVCVLASVSSEHAIFSLEASYPEVQTEMKNNNSGPTDSVSQLQFIYQMRDS